MEESLNNYRQDQSADEAINIQELVSLVWRLKWWIIASALIALILGFFYVRMQTPVYERTSWIMLNKNDGSNSELSLLADISGLKGSGKKIENELFILKSPSMMQKVVEELDLNTRYYHYRLPIGDSYLKYNRQLFNLKHDEFYKDNPFTLTVTADPLFPDELHPEGVSVEFKHLSDSTFRIQHLSCNGGEIKSFRKRECRYGEALPIPGASVSLQNT